MAGLIDGEGTVGIIVTRGKKNRTPCHSVRLTIGNTDLKMLEWVDKNFGGTINPSNDGREERGWKTSYVWSTTGERAERVIASVRPLLITKRKQADLALRLGATRTQTRNALDPKLIARREKMKQKMHELNRKGREAVEAVPGVQGYA